MKIWSFIWIAAMLTSACTNHSDSSAGVYSWPKDVAAPVASKEAHVRTVNGDTVVDNYYWMIDFFKKGPDSTKVVNYLVAENAYLDTMMKGTNEFQKKLYEEMKGRIKEKDESVPVFKNGYFYYTRTEPGKQYYKYCRKKGSLDAQEEILLDVDQMAKDHSYYSTAGFAVSPDNSLLAFGVDTVSRRQYTIYIKNLKTGAIYQDELYPTNSNMVWGNDNKTLFYVQNNTETLLTEKVKRHTLGTNFKSDIIIYNEPDHANYLFVAKSKSNKYVFIYSAATLSSEMRVISADHPDGAFAIFQPRMKDVLYYAEDLRDSFYIVTNWRARNFRLMKCPLNKTDSASWVEMIPHRPDVLIESAEVFRDYLVISERKNGLIQLRVRDMNTGMEHYLDFGEPAYTAYIGENPDYASKVLRYMYSSLTTPFSTFDYNLGNKVKTLMKQQEVVGGYNPSDYVTERLYAIARDSTRVPISIVYKKGFKKDGKSPLLLYGYGSYGNSIDAYFNSNRLSLLDRGFAYAIAHIRGGQEMGRYWYEDGKMMKKKNTFTDFVDCGEFLVSENYTSKDHLYAQGGSAGGLLMGAIINIEPQLWHGVVAQVPFVDVVNTMLDESIPLTSNEFDEWGNPKNKESYFYLKSYSPYENIQNKEYPNLLVTTGLHDSQVQYFEPAKWVAKLRAMKTGKNLLFLHTNMDYGHGGASGRFEYLKEVSLIYAFLFALEGVRN